MTVVVVVTSDSDACVACWFRPEKNKENKQRTRTRKGPRRLPGHALPDDEGRGRHPAPRPGRLPQNIARTPRKQFMMFLFPLGLSLDFGQFLLKI